MIIQCAMVQYDKKERLVHTQTEPDKDDSVAECPDIKEIWNDIYKDDVINSQVESEKVENWAFISNNRDNIGLDNKRKNVSDKSHMIIEPIRSSKALLDDDFDAFIKQQSKEKQGKGDENKVGSIRSENEETS